MGLKSDTIWNLAIMLYFIITCIVNLVYNESMKKYISSKVDVMGGAPVIVGTRIPIAVIIQRLKEGYTIEAIHEGYPWVPLRTIEGAINELIEDLSQSKNDSKILQAQTVTG